MLATHFLAVLSQTKSAKKSRPRAGLLPAAGILGLGKTTTIYFSSSSFSSPKTESDTHFPKQTGLKLQNRNIATYPLFWTRLFLSRVFNRRLAKPDLEEEERLPIRATRNLRSSCPLIRNLSGHPNSLLSFRLGKILGLLPGNQIPGPIGGGGKIFRLVLSDKIALEPGL